MPFVSKAQQRFMFLKHPKIAKEFAAKTPNMKGLPDRVTKARSTKRSPRKSG